MVRNRLAIYLAAYDPYKDVFDIFIDLFEKNWSDCPYTLVIANMYFSYEGKNVVVINCGDEKSPVERKKRALAAVDADYYLGFEEDRMLIDKVDTDEINKILDFMDKEGLDYFRCNASKFRKKKRDRYMGYEHYYHIPTKEPYGVCGSTVIWSKRLMEEREKSGLDNGYLWENYHLRKAYENETKWVPKAATDDRNLLHILHCVDKQRWIPKAKRKLEKLGYDMADSDRKTLSFMQNLEMNVKSIGKFIPVKFRYLIKKGLTKLGMRFYTEY